MKTHISSVHTKGNTPKGVNREVNALKCPNCERYFSWSPKMTLFCSQKCYDEYSTQDSDSTE